MTLQRYDNKRIVDTLELEYEDRIQSISIMIHIQTERTKIDDIAKLVVSKREFIQLLGLEFITGAKTITKTVPHPVIEKFRRYHDTHDH